MRDDTPKQTPAQGGTYVRDPVTGVLTPAGAAKIAQASPAPNSGLQESNPEEQPAAVSGAGKIRERSKSAPARKE